MVAISDTILRQMRPYSMTDMITVSTIAIFAFFLGALAGRALSRNNAADGKSAHNLEKKVADSQESLKRYQQAFL